MAKRSGKKRASSMAANRGRSKHSGTAGRRRTTTEESKRHAIVVLGMHRSGTSAMTRILSLCGAALPKNTMPATSANARGYFESQRIYELHEELLASAGYAWDDASLFSEGWFHSVAASSWSKRMAKVVREEFGESPFFVVKDPRVCRLVPFWKEVLKEAGAEVGFVLLVRNPLEVAASLKKSQGTHETKSQILWLQHFLLAERDTRGCKRSFVAYDEVLNDWRSVVDKIENDLDWTLPRRSRRAEAEVDDFLSEALRHQVIDFDETLHRKDVADWVKRTYRWSLDSVAGNDDGPAELDEIFREFATAEGIYGPVLAASEHANEESIKERCLLENEVGRANQLLDERDTRIRRLDEEVSQLTGWIKLILGWVWDSANGNNAGFPKLEPFGETIEAAGSSAIPQLVATTAQLSERSAEISRLNEENAARGAAIERLREESGSRAAALENVRSELKDKECLLEQMRDQSNALASQVEEQQAEKSARDGAIEQLNQQVAQETDKVRREQTQRQRRELEVEGLERKLERCSSQVTELSAVLKEGDTKLEWTENELRARERAIAERELHIHQMRDALSEIDRSRAWKLTKPLRSCEKSMIAIFRK